MELSTRDDAVSQMAGYRRCDCRYCQRQSWDGSREWDNEDARRHYVIQVVRELSALDGRDAREAVKERVGAAAAVLDGLSRKPTGDDRPRHLEVWGRLLS